jgi:hypothetical protein
MTARSLLPLIVPMGNVLTLACGDDRQPTAPTTTIATVEPMRAFRAGHRFDHSCEIQRSNVRMRSKARASTTSRTVARSGFLKAIILSTSRGLGPGAQGPTLQPPMYLQIECRQHQQREDGGCHQPANHDDSQGTLNLSAVQPQDQQWQQAE